MSGTDSMINDAEVQQSNASGSSVQNDILGRYLRMTGTELKRLSRSNKIELLRELRVRPVRCPSLIALCAAELIHERGGGDLGDEKWLVAEQGVIAHLECGDNASAMRLYRMLQEKFGKTSTRVRKLAGLIHEAAGNFAKAKAVYDGILVDSSAEPFVAKRLAAMEKQKRNYQGAIDVLERAKIYSEAAAAEGQAPELYSYMQVYRGTEESVYRELITLSTLARKFDKALMYSEEAIMLDPLNYLNFVRQAELLYTVGELERSATSFAQAIRLNDRQNCARSIYGLWLCSLEILRRADGGSRRGGGSTSVTASNEASTGVALADARSLHTFAVSKLKSLYNGSAQAGKLTLQLQRYKPSGGAAPQ